MKSILVTGGSGLVGSAIDQVKGNYTEDYYFIFLNSKKCNLLNYQETLNTFKMIKPDYIIHLAASVGGLFKNMSQNVQMLEDNLNMNMNVIKAAHTSDVKNMIVCLSTCIFPDKTEYPINETMIHNGPPHFSNEGYAYAKRLLEIQCKLYNESFKTRYICIIPTNIYGPHDNFHLEDSHVIPGLIHKCFLAKQSGEPFVVRGSGSALRQFLYSKDLARIIMEMIQNYTLTESLIISPREEHSISHVSELINTHFGNEIVFDSSYSDGQHRKTADNSKLLDFLPNFEFTPLEVGLTETIRWFTREYPNIRI